MWCNWVEKFESCEYVETGKKQPTIACVEHEHAHPVPYAVEREMKDT